VFEDNPEPKIKDLMFFITKKFYIPVEFQRLFLVESFKQYIRLDKNLNRKLSSLSYKRGEIILLQN
jgi:hypothetical protein